MKNVIISADNGEETENAFSKYTNHGFVGVRENNARFDRVR